jgi:hypothetical protein
MSRVAVAGLAGAGTSEAHAGRGGRDARAPAPRGLAASRLGAGTRSLHQRRQLRQRARATTSAVWMSTSAITCCLGAPALERINLRWPKSTRQPYPNGLRYTPGDSSFGPSGSLSRGCQLRPEGPVRRFRSVRGRGMRPESIRERAPFFFGLPGRMLRWEGFCWPSAAPHRRVCCRTER